MLFTIKGFQDKESYVRKSKPIIRYLVSDHTVTNYSESTTAHGSRCTLQQEPLMAELAHGAAHSGRSSASHQRTPQFLFTSVHWFLGWLFSRCFILPEV